MRVALLQVALQPKSRAENLQALSAAVDRAAQHDPAPDLIILPGACDTGGVRASDTLTEAIVQSVAETMAWQAREWGVFIAAGLHDRVDETFVPGAVLFDADGDVVCRSGGADAANEGGADPAGSIWGTAVGMMGVVGRPPAPSAGDVVPSGAFIAWPVAAVTPKDRRACDAAVTALRSGPPATRGAYWGVVTAAQTRSPGDAPATFVCGPDGIVTHAPSGDDTIVHAEVGLPIVAVPAFGGMGASGSQAD